MFFSGFCEIFKNTFRYRAPPVAALLSSVHIPTEKKHLVLSSPKWIDSLLSTSQWHTFANSLFKIFSISVTFLTLTVDKRNLCRLHTGKYEYLTKPVEYHLYIAKTTKVSIKIHGELCNLLSLLPKRPYLMKQKKLYL